jgi:hypothetical protein
MINNIIKIIIISGTLVLSSCAFNTTKISFNPIPYEMKVPQELASKLSVEPMTGDWANQIATASVVGALTMHYTAEDNTKHILQEFITLQNKDGFVLSVAGPQDSIFEPFTVDGKNITTLYEEIYKKTTYIKTN